MTVTLHIQLLGEFCLSVDDRPLTSVKTLRLQSLLAYLLVHRDAPQARRHVAFLFWPYSTESQARSFLENVPWHRELVEAYKRSPAR